MIRHLRPLAGLFGAIALGLTMGEAVLAGTCAPGSAPMGSMASMGDMGTAAEGPADRAAACSTMHGPQDHDGPDCPFTQFGSLHGCGPGSSVPASFVLAPTPPPPGRAAPVARRIQPALLMATPFFHPPRA